MYPVDERDKVIELSGLPQSSVGAPSPVVVSDEHTLLLAYLVEDASPAPDNAPISVADPQTFTERLALVEFERYRAHTFGPPNDEAFGGHPLASRGLHPYGAYEVAHSSWVRQLERMNAVHPGHNPEWYKRLKHYIFTFHDSTFECVAAGLVVSEYEESLLWLAQQMVQRLKMVGAV